MMVKLAIMLSVMLSGCNAYIGAGVHPQRDTWGDEYDHFVGMARLEHNINDRLSIEYDHVSSLPDKDQPGLNIIGVMYKLK